MRIMAAGAGVVVLLVILAVVVIGMGGRQDSAKDAVAEKSGDSAEETVAEAMESKQDVETLEVSSGTVLEGKYEKLRSVTVLPEADGSIQPLLYKEDASFPVLESLECGAIFKISDSGERGYFNENDFPQLKSVTLKAVNKYIDEDVLMIYVLFAQMYEEGRLQNFSWENSYTVEDLYGTWTDDKQMLTMTFEADGTLRVADATNLIGVDVLKYKEAGDNTLSLSANQSGVLGMFSINMQYQLLGNQLKIELSGQNFTLTKR